MHELSLLIIIIIIILECKFEAIRSFNLPFETIHDIWAWNLNLFDKPCFEKEFTFWVSLLCNAYVLFRWFLMTGYNVVLTV